ncbi:MAG: DUF4198 domain-containing protein [Hyphomicrobiales bacterium]
MLILFNVAICKPLTRFFYGGAVFLSACVAADAHEFWIEPETSQIERGDKIIARLNVGQDLRGSSYSYLPQRFDRFTYTVGDTTAPVEGRLGDNPALDMATSDNGLHIIAYQSNSEILTYTQASKFEEFLEYEGLDWVLDAHKNRGLPETQFKEAYTRYAKSLVQVGPFDDAATQRDRPVGLPIELVAAQSPFKPDTTSIDVLLLRDGKPLPNIQVATFQQRSDGVFDRRLTRSNEKGKAEISLQGNGFFLVSAVHMEETDPTEFDEDVVGRKPVWKSLWASLTFRLDR